MPDDEKPRDDFFKAYSRPLLVPVHEKFKVDFSWEPIPREPFFVRVILFRLLTGPIHSVPAKTPEKPQ